MPKRVHLPDGRIVNFPDAMTPEAIQSAMAKLSAAPASAPTEPPAPKGLQWKPEHAALGAQIDSAPMMAEGEFPNVIAGAKAVAGLIPRAVRAGAKFQQVMGAAKAVPIDITGPGNTALRIMQLSERGGVMPKAVRDLLKRMTDPNKPPMAYEEARDFASNISRLSADEFNRLTPALRREVGNLRVTLNRAVEKAADTAGKGKEYRSAMKEYARAARGREMVDNTKDFLKKWAIPGGIATYGVNKLADLLRD